ncbi:hypothetical protein AB0D30_17430 [Streptomyces sp. NPDC048409]|uniref:hypothetical protein n=1 Tax=Streptomyces sp. NPDC048409 TaxID=3154723 RepID=UPI0034372342
MRHSRPKKSNRSLRTWVLGPAAGLALVVGGGIAAQAATGGHAHPTQSAPSDPKPVPSTPGTHGSGHGDPTPVPGDANGKPYPKPVPSTPGTHGSGHGDPTPVPGDANGKPYPKPVPSTPGTHGSGHGDPVPVPGDANGKPYSGTTGR